MDIKEIMTDGKIDGGKMYQLAMNSGNDSFLDDFLKYAEVINAHLASLTQSTPITPELLERAGFVWNTRKEYFTKLDHAYFRESGSFWINNNTDFNPKTMEQLSIIWECYTGQPLNWQHDPAAELRQRLEAMGFKSNADNHYRWFFGEVRWSVEIHSLGINIYIEGNKTGIKTIDALERVVKELKGE